MALSPVYTRTNLFDSFTRLHNLLPPDSKELTRINQHGVSRADAPLFPRGPLRRARRSLLPPRATKAVLRTRARGHMPP